MKIFYVEDNPVDLDLARRSLARQAPHYEFEATYNCASARQRLDRLASDPLDVLLTDMRLPDGDGLSLLAYVRKKELPLAVVILTGSGDEETAVAALKAGADDYLVKRPGYLSGLASVLESALQRFHAEADRRVRPLLVLYADTRAEDLELTRHHLAGRAPHINLETASSGSEALERALRQEFDVLLLDYRLPELSGLDLLKELRSAGRDTPVVLVTGQGNQEAALQALRLGASDYILKNPGYLARIPAALENAHYQAQLGRERAALQASEKRFRLLAENAQDIIYRLQILPEMRFDYLSPSLEKVTGYIPADFYANPRLVESLVKAEDLGRIQGLAGSGGPWSMRWRRKDGSYIWVELSAAPVFDAQGSLEAIEGIVRDVTERQQAEEERQRLFDQLESSHQDLVEAYDATIAGWSHALELRDRETEGHSTRVVEMTLALARRLNVPEAELPHLRRGALLHDIGKLAIPDAILHKPAPLSEEEWEIMRLHPVYSGRVLQPIAFLGPALDIPRCHHEHWDGSGYPKGLRGEQIPLAARIFTVVDVYDALCFNRPYRLAWPKERILKYLASESGKLLDPRVVEAFLEMVH
jgi:PAS domain S-box-containing protein